MNRAEMINAAGRTSQNNKKYEAIIRKRRRLDLSQVLVGRLIQVLRYASARGPARKRVYAVGNTNRGQHAIADRGIRTMIAQLNLIF